ncbi:hypothetical protein H0H92_011221 [Tricholoma furcatifolium]|nr:hypothetical protein H0H92_011221 [Tricholoma furcatifolium]
MSTAPNTAHQGIWMENGSGGFMGDLVFNGGKYGMWVGNQQFTLRNITINNAQTAVFSIWNWGWTFQGITINNCQVGFDLLTGGITETTQTVGSMAIIDAVVTNTPIFVRNSKPSTALAGSLVINNAKLTNVQTAVGVVGGAVVLAGGAAKTIASWAQGNVFHGTSPNGSFVQDNVYSPNKPSSLLDGGGRVFGKRHPQYEGYAVSEFVSVRDNGAKGDGRTDDTAALKAVFAKYAGCKIIFFDAGTYIVTSTLTIPAGARVVGEAWSVISGQGPAFQDKQNPQVVVRVGDPGSQGVVEITDVVFSTVGPAPGAIVVEWNVKQPDGVQGGAGTWDTHIRIGGALGTNLQTEQCPTSATGAKDNCYAAFLALHITSGSTAYLEGLWAWAADHDLDGGMEDQISIYSARGILSESAGPVWMIGTASQPYYQPSPAAPAPFAISAALKDPTFPADVTSAWAFSVASSKNIIVFGAGLYSFFICLTTSTCQTQTLNVDSASDVALFSVSTVGTTWQVSVNGQGVVNEALNSNGFAETVTVWSRA